MTMQDGSGPEGTGADEREIVISRTIHGPRDLVFEAFTDVRHLAHWWGPDGFTTTTRAFEFRVGGVWEFSMRGPDGTVYPEWVRWTEISEPDRLEMIHGEYQDDPNSFVSIIVFEAVGEDTRIEMRTVFPTAKQRDEAVERFGAVEGGRQTLRSLADYVERGLRGEPEL